MYRAGVLWEIQLNKNKKSRGKLPRPYGSALANRQLKAAASSMFQPWHRQLLKYVGASPAENLV